MLDSFSGPNQASLLGESRAAYPPGKSGGSILAISGSSEIASDRGLFGAASALAVINGQLGFSLPTGIAEFDWNVDGFDFTINNFDTIVWRDFSNNSGADISLRIQIFQTFDGTGSVVGGEALSFTFASGETRELRFNAIQGETDFVGFRAVNDSAATFIGALGAVTSVLQPAVLPFMIIAASLGVLARRRAKGCSLSQDVGRWQV